MPDPAPETEELPLFRHERECTDCLKLLQPHEQANCLRCTEVICDDRSKCDGFGELCGYCRQVTR
jgi:hypothetical protein